MTTNGYSVLLDVEDLRVHFDTDEGLVKAVDGLSLKIRRGTTLGIVGESGCGKTVAARALLRVVAAPGKIVSGKVTLHREATRNGTTISESIELTGLDANGREMQSIRGRDISMVFQEPMSAFSPVHTIGSQIMEAILLHTDASREEARLRAIEMLHQVGMPEADLAMDRLPHQLSGGMCQRAMIAMALSCQPKLLIADEPTTALDVTTQAQILALLRDLQRQLNMTILYITHDMGVIAQLCDEVSVMYLGKVVEQARVRDLFYDTKHPYTRALLRSIPRLGRVSGTQLESITGNVPDPYNLPNGCKFHPRCPSFMPGVCDQREPEMRTVAEQHSVSCFLYSEERKP